ncbi:MutS-related protein [Runella slithyformis]|uniref:DNA mismatch repair protein MutS domain protein n=1 Tax=Runella slithyformis (strain ATCC 29530 / DSM 19594 / LMG 11500 / NCIMB 11436 / LSU 4) TaxID=761193 RepID=A0A7U4E906_RUNSL|nr:DNA mismatch repair protein MutS [Runella slithyformis]AEI51884.1 DNA mismatch repair protein MutS domain protein [Runella slithyformis DSM 19594]
MTPSDIFTKRQTEFTHQAEVFQRSYNQLSTVRLIIFVAAVFTVWQTLSFPIWIPLVSGIVGLTLFAFILRRHQTTKRQWELHRALAALNTDEAERLSLRFARSATGAEFAVKNHVYCNDLDIFGPHSLFRLLNRAHTRIGMQTLAEWLLSPADPIEISVRQDAIRELTPLLDWRQELEANARLEKRIAEPTDFLERWLHAGENKAILRWKKLRLLPVLTISIIIGAFLGWIPWLTAVLFLGFHSFILTKLNPSVKEYAEQSQGIVDTLKALGILLEKIEKHSFQSAKLQQLQYRLTSETGAASKQIKVLASVTESLNFRLNPYFMLAIGLPSLWDLQWMTKLEAWKQTHRHNLAKWLAVVGQMEALGSLAGFSYANPQYPFAEISPEVFQLKALKTGHPLIHPAKRVSNDFALNDIGQTAVITGSNMSGKSTFLRTVGLNTVLALAGSPVCAEAFTCSPVRVFTSMRTQDSLEDNTSSFYAELKRLEALLQLAQSSSIPVFYFLDEILKGTNSVDRHKGAEALIRQLHVLKSSGFVSTHDLELGMMSIEHDYVHNYSFYSTFSDGQLHFDYHLQEGVCREFNATALMRQIGIEIN